jgi:tripartite-type tricarboxylate transporter receptor subunit TctC
MFRRNILSLVALGLLSLLSLLSHSGAVRAEVDYPSRLITLVVPVPPGGLVDMIARSLAERLSAAWGQGVIVKNMSGGGFQIGVTSVAKSAPDGYTLLVAMDAAFVVNPHLYKSLSYDPAKDFIPVSGLVSSDSVLLANLSFPANNVGELIEIARKKPGELNYGSFGVGSASHLGMVLLEMMAGVELVPIDYKGAAPMITDVIAGHVPVAFGPMAVAQELWRSGKIKILGVSSPTRLSYAPELPTLAESGLPGYQARPWFGLFAPSGTPADVVSKINTEVQRILADPAFKENAVHARGMGDMARSPEQLAELIKSDNEKWREVFRAANISAR